MKVKRQDTGEIIVVTGAQLDWVESNFKPESLATAQKVFLSYYDQLPVKANKHLKKVTHEIRFVDVEDQHQTIYYNNKQINKIKYMKPKRVKKGSEYQIAGYRTTLSGVKVPIYATDENGQRIKSSITNKQDVILPEKWIGYCKDKQKTIQLSEDFVNENFSRGYLQQVKHLSKKKNTRWIAIPLGADKKHDKIPAYLQTGPEIKF